MISSAKNEEKIFLRYSHEIFEFMNNIVSYNTADKLHSITIARCYCFLRNRTFHHMRMDNYVCYCFECRLTNLLCRILVERQEQRNLFHLNVSNYDELDDVEILEKVLVADM